MIFCRKTVPIYKQPFPAILGIKPMLLNRFKLFFGRAANRAILGSFFVGYISADLAYMIGIDLVLYNVHHGPFIQLGMI